MDGALHASDYIARSALLDGLEVEPHQNRPKPHDSGGLIQWAF